MSGVPNGFYSDPHASEQYRARPHEAQVVDDLRAKVHALELEVLNLHEVIIEKDSFLVDKERELTDARARIIDYDREHLKRLLAVKTRTATQPPSIDRSHVTVATVVPSNKPATRAPPSSNQQ